MSNFNNNFLTNNNNMNNNNNNNNSIVHKSHKIDTSNNNDHKSGQCIELKTTAAAAVTKTAATPTTNAACSVKNINRSDDDVAVIRHEIDIEGDIDVDDVDDDDNVEDGGDVNETDTRSSSKSNFSNIDVECERDERKPNVKNFSGIVQSVAQDSSSSAGWISCSSPTDKLANNDALIYTNCGTGDTTITHPPPNNGCNLMVNNFKKEVSQFLPSKKKHISNAQILLVAYNVLVL